MKEYQYILTYDGTSTTLGFNPAGYDRLGLTWLRHEFYHSVLRSFTLSLRFVNLIKTGIGTGGYNIIQAAYDAEGIFADVSVQIKKRNPMTNDYDLLYSGVLDFTPGKWTIDRDLFWEISINDSSKLQKFIARDENEIDLYATQTIDGASITAPTPLNVSLTPIDIITKTEFTCDETPPTDVIVNDIDIPLTNAIFTLSPNNNTVISGINTIFTNNDTSTKILKITGVIDYNWITTYYKDNVHTSNIKYRIIIKNAGVEVLNEIIIEHDVLPNGVLDEGPFYFNDSGQYILAYQVDDVLSTSEIEYYIKLEINRQSPSSWHLNDTTTHYVLIKEINPGLATTKAKALKSFAAFEQSLEIITGEANQLVSTVMGSGGSLEQDFVMNGLQIRRYPTPKVNVKFRSLFKSFDAVNNLGLGFDNVNDNFYIENKATFFDGSTLMFDLGEVAKFKIQPYTPSYFSKIAGGFNNTGDYERVQGALEFAVNREYSTKAKVKDEKDIKAPYRFDSVGIEELRNLQYLDTASEDNNSDNDIFIVRTTREVIFLLIYYYPTLPTVGSPEYLGMDTFYSYYNTMLTPRQNAIRWGNIISACHYKNTGNLQAQKTDKQYELEVDGVDENSDITMAQLGSALFIPEKYIFESYLTPANISTLLANPHGYIRLSYNNVYYEGFIDKIELTDYNSKAVFELIAKDNTINNRIFEDGNNHLFEDGSQKISE